MGTLLSRIWLSDSDSTSLEMIDGASVAVLREAVRDVAAGAGLDKISAESLVTAASELGNNQVFHGGGGRSIVRRIERDGVNGVEVITADAGLGISDLAAAFSGTTHDPKGLGVGLAGVASLADELDADVRINEGSCFWARKFAAPVARRREIAIFGRPLAGERQSGDFASFRRDPDGTLLLAVADGLGHGVAARQASEAVIDAVLASPSRSTQTLVEAADRSAIGTRGAVLGLLLIDERLGAIEHSGFGDVAVIICGPKHSRSIAAAGGFLGGPDRRRAMVERGTIEAAEVLIAASDGLSTRKLPPPGDPLFRCRAALIAGELMTRAARGTDDVMVAVAV